MGSGRQSTEYEKMFDVALSEMRALDMMFRLFTNDRLANKYINNTSYWEGDIRESIDRAVRHLEKAFNIAFKKPTEAPDEPEGKEK